MNAPQYTLVAFEPIEERGQQVALSVYLQVNAGGTATETNRAA
jgi:hypothetical protein